MSAVPRWACVGGRPARCLGGRHGAAGACHRVQEHMVPNRPAASSARALCLDAVCRGPRNGEPCCASAAVTEVSVARQPLRCRLQRCSPCRAGSGSFDQSERHITAAHAAVAEDRRRTLRPVINSVRRRGLRSLRNRIQPFIELRWLIRARKSRHPPKRWRLSPTPRAPAGGCLSVGCRRHARCSRHEPLAPYGTRTAGR